AAVERVALLHVGRAGDDLLAAARDDEAEAAAEALAQQLEEARVQVAAPVEVRVDVRAVAAVHRLEELVGDRVAGHRLDTDAQLAHALALAPHLVPALAAQRRQVIVEAGVARVVPVVLDPDPRQEAARLERLALRL